MSADVDICVRRYVQEDGAAVRTFIRDHVRADHSITQDWLFDWFYRGVGNENGAITSVVLEWNGEVAGFRGMIPGLFQVPGEDGKVSIVQGGTYAFLNIRGELRGRKLGYRMYEKTAEISQRFITTLGSNRQTSAPIYYEEWLAEPGRSPSICTPAPKRRLLGTACQQG